MPAIAGPLHAALSASIPLVCFLTAVIWLARIAEATGLAGAIAGLLSRAAGARTARVYALVCIACALLTVALSLDGAVVVMVPVVLALADRGAPARPLLLGTIGVANAFSIAVVQGNPTNLVVMTGLHLGPATFDATMVAPGLAAALICAGAVALRERRSLGGDMGGPESTPPLGRGAAVAAAALGMAGAGESLAPVAGIAPWWPACAVAAGAALCLAASRVELPRPAVPWRIGLLVTALATALGVAAGAAGISSLRLPAGSVWALLAVTAAAALVAAVVNNLPAAVAAGALLHTGPAAFAVLSGVSVGALAGTRGSVATLLVCDLAGPGYAPAIREGYLRLWPATAAVAASAATALVWAMS
ncbi:MAG TPA: SLC13 family permease [Gaiellales bacterium]